MLDDLYQDIILQAAKDTQFRGSLSGQAGAVNVRLHNPLCGDSLDLWLRIDGDRIQGITYEGHGCLISQAAANLLAREIHDLPVGDAEAVCDAFRKLILTDTNEREAALLGQLTALSGVRKIPARARCALLSCEAVERVLHHRQPQPQQRQVANG